MKPWLTIAIAATALTAAVTASMAAGLYQREPVTAADALPAYEILNSVRSLGLRPTTQALRRGPYYVLHAIDTHGIEVRVVADAQLGDIVSVAPLRAPRYDSGPRIIHVPQPGERDNQAGAYEDDQAAVPSGDDDVDEPPPLRRRAVPRSDQRSDLPPASRPKPPTKAEPRRVLGPPHAVLSAPPSPTSLTPIYPTPKFGAKSNAGEKFSPADNAASSLPSPGHTPPAAPPDKQDKAD